MANAWPASLKPLGKYLERGRECKAVSPIVSYYCNLYSAKEGIRRISGSDDALGEQFVKALLEKCESEKQFVGSDDGTHQQIVEAYALARFKEADDEDIYGPVTQGTADKYFRAMCYLDVCGVFGKRNDEAESKRKFAMHRAAIMRKAFREGRQPKPREMPDTTAAAPGGGTPLPPSQVDAHQPYPHTMIGRPAEPSAPLPTVNYNADAFQQYTSAAAGPAEPSAPMPTVHYDAAAMQQYAAGEHEPSAPLPTVHYDAAAMQQYAAASASAQGYGAQDEKNLGYGPPRNDSAQSYGKSSYPPSEQRWTPSASPPPDPLHAAPDNDAANAISKLSLGKATYPDVAPVYESFEDKQSFMKGAQGTSHPQPPTRPLPSPPPGTPYSGGPRMSFDKLKTTSSTASHVSDASSVHVVSYAPTPPPARVQTQVQTPVQPPMQPPMQPPVQSPHQAVKQSAGPAPPAARSNFTPSIQNMKLAQGYARDAFSALDFPDVSGAIIFLEKALAELKGS